jgi:hypothetical protein
MHSALDSTKTERRQDVAEIITIENYLSSNAAWSM